MSAYNRTNWTNYKGEHIDEINLNKIEEELARISGIVDGLSGDNITNIEDINNMKVDIATLKSAVDSIPKYNYLQSISTTVADGSNQETINSSSISAISTVYDSPNKWDAVVVSIKFDPSDISKDALYYYNGESWIFLYYVSTGINRASGVIAGIVESSSDITFTDGYGSVNIATKLRTARTISFTGAISGSATFDGSSNISIKTSYSNKVYYAGATAPTDTNLLWINTNNKVIYYHNGTSWINTNALWA